MSRTTDAAKPAANQVPSWAKLIALSAHMFEAKCLIDDLMRNAPEALDKLTTGEDWQEIRDRLDNEYNPAFSLMRGRCPNAAACFCENLILADDAYRDPAGRQRYVKAQLDYFRDRGVDTANLETICK